MTTLLFGFFRAISLMPLAVALSIAGVLILVIVKREHQRMKQEQALIDEESTGA